MARYPDSLAITEIEPVVEYLRSTMSMRIDRYREEEISRMLKVRIHAEGALRVTKDAGLFIAVKENIE